MQKLSNLLNSVKEARILDVGTGNGNFVRTLAGLSQDFSEIIGIDIIDAAIKSSSEAFSDKRIKFIKMDALNMDFEDNSFDFVALSNSLHHLERRQETLNEMHRVLKPGGAIIISEMISNGLSKKQKSHLKMHHFAAELDTDNGIYHGLTFSDKKIIEILKSESKLELKAIWEFMYPRKEENTLEEMEWLFGTIDKLTAKMEDSPKIEEYIKKADGIKKYMRKYGFDSATQIIVVLQ